MKLSNLALVRDLKRDLDYVASIREALKSPGAKLIVDRMHVRPDLAATVFPMISTALDTEERKIKADLADLGVEP